MSATRNPLSENFTQIPNELILDKKIPNGAFRVMVYLFSKPSGWVVNNGDIKKQLGIGQNDTIAEYWRKLIDEGWITRVRNSGGGFDYDLNIEKKPTADIEDGGVFGKTPNRGNPVYGEMPNHSNTDFNSNTEEEKDNSSVSTEPPLLAEGSKGMPTTRVHTSPPGFDELWEVYGLKRSKPDAIKAYSKIPAKDMQNLLSGVKAYLAYLKLPDNSWRQQKLLAAFIRQRMWEDDWGQPKASSAEQTPNEKYMTEMMASYPNLKSLTWLSDDEYVLVSSQSKSFLGDRWEYRVSQSQLDRIIEDSWREMNQNGFKRKNHTSVYSFLKEEVKSRIYTQ